MTQDEIIEIARQAGMLPHSIYDFAIYVEELEAFAKLVTAKEREACWKIACEYTQLAQSHTCLAVADAIRARGEA